MYRLRGSQLMPSGLMLIIAPVVTYCSCSVRIRESTTYCSDRRALDRDEPKLKSRGTLTPEPDLCKPAVPGFCPSDDARRFVHVQLCGGVLWGFRCLCPTEIRFRCGEPAERRCNHSNASDPLGCAAGSSAAILGTAQREPSKFEL